MKHILKGHIGAKAGITLLCLIQASGLLEAWLHSPFSRYGMVAFLIWLLPFLRLPQIKQDSRYNVIAAVTLVLVILGTITNLNALCYIALALTMSLWFPVSHALIIWIIGSLSWMPVLGWSLSGIGVNLVNELRIGIAVFTSAYLIIYHLNPLHLLGFNSHTERHSKAPQQGNSTPREITS